MYTGKHRARVALNRKKIASRKSAETPYDPLAAWEKRVKEEEDKYLSIRRPYPRNRPPERIMTPGTFEPWDYYMGVDVKTGRELFHYRYVWDDYEKNDEGLFNVLLQLGKGDALEGYRIMHRETTKLREQKALIFSLMAKNEAPPPPAIASRTEPPSSSNGTPLTFSPRSRLSSFEGITASSSAEPTRSRAYTP